MGWVLAFAPAAADEFLQKTRDLQQQQKSCNCPPSYVIWSCSEEEYASIMNGTSCSYYRHDALAGGDRDEHDCIPSAGYTWCAAMGSCIRLWEQNLTSEVSFKKRCSTAALELTGLRCNCPPSYAIWSCSDEEYASIKNGTACAYYRHAALAGGDRDEHDCIPSAGYTWCAAMGSCIRPWE